MKKILCIGLVVVAAMRVSAQTPQGIPWYDNKYSMFIHFGLYSELGGVWEGKRVEKGYSEQIQSWGGIQGDLYENLACTFNPDKFNADSIVALAKAAGMRSIVITSKHHDGFCLFRTLTTEFNMYDATPSHRDLIAELSSACRRGGVAFGLYYSLVDWHAPCADHITTHNATFITPEHHRLNMAQVEELVTGYGDISELWFDMGSLTPEQSRELYRLVRKYQPDCMVSGRLGNGYYDFSVMSDNHYPSESLQTPWQAPASMFNSTWGYRSWQERGSSHEKAQEKLRSLLNVVSGGGNFLLNIGPDGRGEVVPFERDVLLEIGRWLGENGDVVYGTSASPFSERFSWGVVTKSGKKLNFILSGEKPQDGVFSVPMRGYRLAGVSGPATASFRNGFLRVTLAPDAYTTGDIKVVRLSFDKEVIPETSVRLNEKTACNSYFCQDYYTNSVSAVNYSWSLKPRRTLNSLTLTHTASEVGIVLDAIVDGKDYQVLLSDENPSAMNVFPITVNEKKYCIGQMADFAIDDGFDEPVWQDLISDSGSFDCRPMMTMFVRERVTSPVEQDILLEVGAGNGIELYVNDKPVMIHLNPYRCTFKSELVRIHLKAGENVLMLRSYNRFEKKITWLMRMAPSQVLYSTDFGVPSLSAGKVHKVTLKDASASTKHEDCKLHNVEILNIH